MESIWTSARMATITVMAVMLNMVSMAMPGSMDIVMDMVIQKNNA